MKAKAGILLVLAAFFIVVSLSFSLAITGSMGNSRMVLRLSPGETVEKYILVKNVNNESIVISLSVSGNLSEYVNIRDNNFTLQPGEDKKAYFTIKAAKSGTTETKILVKFSPIVKGSAVGLASTIIVITGEVSAASDNTNEQNSSNSSGFSFNPKAGTGSVAEESKSNFSISPIMLLPISTIVLAAVLIALSIYLRKMKNRKVRTKSKKSAKRS